MVEQCLPRVWRVGGGSWHMKSRPALSDEEDCNIYLVQGGTRQLLVDGGTLKGMRRIESNIREIGFALTGITDLLLTHCHADHTEAAESWRIQHGVRTHLSVIGAAHLDRGDKCLLGGDGYPSFGVDHRVSDGEGFEAAGIKVKSIAAPGHCPDCMLFCTVLDGQSICFSGDVCFAPADWDPEPGIVGTLGALWKSNLSDYRETLERMLRLKIDALFPGHGPVVKGEKEVRETVAAALQTIERFLATPKIYAFYLPK